jgi:hypothetical protein
MVETVARLAGTGDRQEAAVTVVHVARVWGTALGMQHPALQPSAGERRNAQDVVVRAALQLRVRGIEAEALVASGRLSRLLRGPDPARKLLDRAAGTLIAVRD